MPQVRARLLLLLLLVSIPVAASAKDPEPEPDPWLSFIQGKFTFIGREPDGGATYAGDATIVEKAGKLVMSRKVAGKTVEALGTKEVPHPPGEGQVLRFRWKEDQKAKIMTCLVSTDLDNYARLSCVWVVDQADHKSPGFEAYFSTDAWSE